MPNRSKPAPDGPGSPLDEVGPALARLRRRAGRGRTDLMRNIVLNLVAEGAGRATVGSVAQELGVAQPVASRAVARCLADGLVRRIASQQDGRSSLLELTTAGEAAGRTFAAEQRSVFEEITELWKPADQVQFARYLARYSREAGIWSARGATPPS